MLPKKNRTNKQEIDTVFKKGVSIWSLGLSLKFHINPKEATKKISFVVSKKVEKLANKRNSLKRKGYLVVKSYLDRFPPGFNGVFTIKNRELTTETIKQDLEKILSKIN